MQRHRDVSWEDPEALRSAARALPGLECLRRIAAGEWSAPPMARLMDIRLAEVEAGRAVFVAAPAEHHENPQGIVHGGFGATMLDSAMGCAVWSTLDAGDLHTTAEFKINFLKPIRAGLGEVRGVGTVIHAGRTAALAEGRLEGPDGTLYAFATATCLIRRSAHSR
jgi:uncharacterized protein (TIGR00369 family)